jgi:hypothetical protein
MRFQYRSAQNLLTETAELPGTQNILHSLPRGFSTTIDAQMFAGSLCNFPKGPQSVK